jgi:formate hydrogenlyase subunit 3/multisubunit Na+/H+ antiporter MnhD subunit
LSEWALCCCAAAVAVVYATHAAGAMMRPRLLTGTGHVVTRTIAVRLPTWGGLCGWLLVELAVCLCIADAVRGLSRHVWTSDGGALITPLWDGAGPGLALRLDSLASLFLLILAGVAAPALLVCLGWWRRSVAASSGPGAAMVAAAALLVAVCILVILAANVWTLLLAWEGLTLAFYWVTMIERTRPDRVEAAVAAINFGKASGALLTTGLFLLAADSGSMTLSGLAAASPTVRALGYVLLLGAFATKAGLVPLHVWLPRSYGAAPGPMRALMAGAAVNVAFYGCWRTLDVLGPPPGWLADVVMVAGAISALVGIAHAAVQTRLTQVIAYSSVENAGLILAAYGVALVGAAAGSGRLMAAGLLAGTLQTVAHAIGKTLLFTSAGVIETATGTDQLDELRGLGRLMPWTGTGLAVGSVTMAGLPPGVVFVSEWFVLETLMQQFRLDHRLVYTLPMALTGALVALTAGFAGVAFVRLVAFTVLGRTAPGLEERSRLRGLGTVGRTGLVALCAGCVVVAALTPWEIAVISRGLASLVTPSVVRGAVTDRWVLGPVYPDFSVLSPSWLCIELPLMLAAVLVVSRLLGGSRMWAVRRVQPWRSATGGVTGADEYTPFGYANPTRRVLANVLRPYSEVRELEAKEHQDTAAHLVYRADVLEVSEHYLYRPIAAAIGKIVGVALRLQSGRLDAYLLYMLAALVAVLAVVSAGW